MRFSCEDLGHSSFSELQRGNISRHYF